MSGEQLLLVVRGLGVAERVEREAAEGAYERDWLARPAVLFPALLEVIGSTPDPMVRLGYAGLSYIF